MAKKRANGEGSIHRLPSGSWQTQIMDGYKPDGTRKFKTITAPTQSALKKQKLEYDKKKSDGTLSDKEYTFAEWAAIWFEHHKNTISATTQEGYKYTLRILHDYFGHRKLADIKVHDIEEFLLHMKKNEASDSQITKLRGMLCQIFNKAVANDLVVKNPAAHLDKMKRAPKKPRESFTRDEVDKMMKELPDNKIGWSIRLLLFTGMRPGEILGLEPRHIAKDGSWINIEQATVKVKGTTEIGPPKTVDSYRTVPVPELVRYCARNLRNTDKKFIWDSPKKPGHPCNESYFRTLFKEALAGIEGVRVLTPYNCRHTCISHLVALGVDPITITSIVGHADTDMINEVYAHPLEHARQDAIKRFDDAFSNRQGDTQARVLQFVKSS
jgi:integrase